MIRVLKAIFLLYSLSFLQGCILLLPLIEKNQAEQRAMNEARDEKKSCFLAGNLAAKSYTGSYAQIEEAQAFVAAHQSQRRTRKRSKQQRLAMLKVQLQKGTEVARTHAATDIGLMGRTASSAVEDLSRSLRYDESKWVRRAAVKSLAKISGAEVIAPLQYALKDRNKWVAHSARNALRKVNRELGQSAAEVNVQRVVYRAN